MILSILFLPLNSREVSPRFISTSTNRLHANSPTTKFTLFISTSLPSQIEHSSILLSSSSSSWNRTAVTNDMSLQRACGNSLPFSLSLFLFLSLSLCLSLSLSLSLSLFLSLSPSLSLFRAYSLSLYLSLSLFFLCPKHSGYPTIPGIANCEILAVEWTHILRGTTILM